MKIDVRNIPGPTLAAGLGLVIAALALVLYGFDLSRISNFNRYESHPLGGDFPIFWATARLVVNHIAEGAYWQEVLSRQLAEVNLMFSRPYQGIMPLNNPLYYPPVYLFFLAPFGHLAYFPALLTFWLCSLAVFLCGIWQLTRERWIVLFMLGFSAIWLNLVVGQNGLLTAGLLALGLAFLGRQPVLAGIFFGLLCYKPHLGLLIPFALLAGRYYRPFFFAAVTAIGLIFCSLAVYGPEVWLGWVGGFTYASLALQDQASLWQRMPTVYALLRLLGAENAVGWWVQLAFSLSVLAVVVLIWRRGGSTSRLAGAALALGAVLTTPFVYDYDQAVLGIALALLLPELRRTGWQPAEKVLIPLIYLWPVLINNLQTRLYGLSGLHLQLGFLPPLLLLLLVFRRARLESGLPAIAPPPAPALQSGA